MGGGPSQADVGGPVDFYEEGPRIYARHDGDATDVGPDLGDFRDYGAIRDWTSALPESTGADYTGADVSDTWLPKEVDQFRSAGKCGDLPVDRVALATRYDPYGASDEDRFQIALSLKTIRDWVEGGS